MTYRYMFLLLHSANAMFLARRSRVIGSFSGSENRRWAGPGAGDNDVKSQKVEARMFILAMLARGYRGEVRVLEDFRLQRRTLSGLPFH